MLKSDSFAADTQIRQAPQAPRESTSLQAASSREGVALAFAHETPSIADAAIFTNTTQLYNTPALLSIVEEQARDLLRLRRALVAAKTIAEQRLHAINSLEEGKARAGKLQLERQVEGDASTSEVFGELARIHRLLDDLLRSRWRKIGQRLGIATRPSWEPDGWRSPLVEMNERYIPSACAYRELHRLHDLLEDMLLSRWRKIGQKLGLATRLNWESGDWRSPLVSGLPIETNGSPSFGGGQPAHLPPPEKQQSEYASFVEYTTRKFLEECRSFGADVLLDVGANVGQFAQSLRACGYLGHIISFEPLSDAHSTLKANAAADPLWDVAERCAVGAAGGNSRINIAGNSYSSSLLPMLERHREAAPESVYNGSEACQVISLDDYIETTFSDATTTFGLKIDTQGFEGQVMAGLMRNCRRVKVVVCEMSVSPLYEGAPTVQTLSQLFCNLGYHCVALGPEFEDPQTGELLQINGIFVQRYNTAGAGTLA
jgi:FkbM family methyltransferase